MVSWLTFVNYPPLTMQSSRNLFTTNKRTPWIWLLLLVGLGAYEMVQGWRIGSNGEMLWGAAFIVGALAVLVKLRWLGRTAPNQRSQAQQRIALLVSVLGAVTVVLAIVGFCMKHGFL